MQQTEEADLVTQIYSIYIQATAQDIWNAITQPEWNSRYGYQVPQEYELTPGGRYMAKPSDMMKQMREKRGQTTYSCNPDKVPNVACPCLLCPCLLMSAEGLVRKRQLNLSTDLQAVHGSGIAATLVAAGDQLDPQRVIGLEPGGIAGVAQCSQAVLFGARRRRGKAGQLEHHP